MFFVGQRVTGENKTLRTSFMYRKGPNAVHFHSTSSLLHLHSNSSITFTCPARVRRDFRGYSKPHLFPNLPLYKRTQGWLSYERGCNLSICIGQHSAPLEPFKGHLEASNFHWSKPWTVKPVRTVYIHVSGLILSWLKHTARWWLAPWLPAALSFVNII